MARGHGWTRSADRLPLWLPVFMGAGVLWYYGLRFEPAVWLGPAAVPCPAIAAAVALAPAALAVGAGGGIGAGFRLGPVRHRAIAADRGGVAAQCDGRHRHRARRRSPAGRSADHHPSPRFSTGRPSRCGARSGSACGRTMTRDLQTGDKVTCAGDGPRAGAAVLSRRLGPAARRVLCGAGRLRLRPRSGGPRGQAPTARSDAPGAEAAGDDRRSG